jgi:hypothetical protein
MAALTIVQLTRSRYCELPLWVVYVHLGDLAVQCCQTDRTELFLPRQRWPQSNLLAVVIENCHCAVSTLTWVSQLCSVTKGRSRNNFFKDSDDDWCRRDAWPSTAAITITVFPTSTELPTPFSHMAKQHYCFARNVNMMATNLGRWHYLSHKNWTNVRVTSFLT